MHYKRYFLMGLSSLWPTIALAQSDDFGVWTSIGAEKDLTKQLSVEAGVDFRAEDRLESVARWAGSVGLGYKVCRNFKLGVGYVYLYDRELQEGKVNYNEEMERNGYNVDHGFGQSKHRFTFDAIGSIKAGRFKFSLRERYQLTHSLSTDCLRDRYRNAFDPDNAMGYNGPRYEYNGEWFKKKETVTDGKSSKNRHYLRSRLQVEYNIPKCPFNPFVSYEITNNLENGMDSEKGRLIVGTEYKLTKQHIFSFGYLFEQGMDGEHEGAKHILDLGYKFKF